MIGLFTALAYLGNIVVALILLLISDILNQANPQAAMLPFVALLFLTLTLPLIASRGGR